MAQVKFTKLKLKMEENFQSFDFNGEVIEVKQYLPSIEKVKMVSRVVTQSMAGRVVRDDLLEFYLNLEIIFNYTNITFTNKQKDDLGLYDKFETTGLFDNIIALIPEQEYNTLVDYINDYATKLQAMSNIMVSGYSTQVEGMQEVINKMTSENIAETFLEDETQEDSTT